MARKTIGENPLDTVIPTKPTRTRKRKAEPEPTPRPQKIPKVRATFHLPSDLVDEARDAVVALSGPPIRLTLAALAENAIRRELARLKKAHNNGKNFPQRAEDLKGGRPVGS